MDKKVTVLEERLVDLQVRLIDRREIVSHSLQDRLNEATHTTNSALLKLESIYSEAIK